MPRYTHFWSLSDKVPDRLAWPRIVRDVQVVLEAFAHLVVCKGHTRSTRYTAQSIEFDSDDPTDHTAFVVKLGKASFQYCRTMRLEYDLPVSAVLLVIKRHAPQWIKLTSDGRWADFQPARELLRDLLEYQDEDFASAKIDFDELFRDSDEYSPQEDNHGPIPEEMDEASHRARADHRHRDRVGPKR
jgi:hypothetical protein